VVVAGNRDIGVLYGVFALLRRVQMNEPLDELAVTEAPRIQRRILDHWDNLNGTIERGYAGFSLWNWFALPDYLDPRYTDYARACASIGINGTVLTNVNADALVLTEPYLRKVAALASVFRPYGIRVYLTARFSAPAEIGGLKTSDPLDPGVVGWWNKKVDEIYGIIPDFGGFLVKANSEGQPGPQDYGRTHADGANLLADALAPHGGIVMWRAFVYDQRVPADRIRQAYDDFQPLDGRFHSNVVVQIKNGPLDFQPREPFHPLFGAMPRTPLAAELQITQEYLGASVHLAYLAPMWRECLESDTFAAGPGSTVARIVDGSLNHHSLSVIAGVANTGSERNWRGHPLAAANWYAFGRLAWDHTLGADTIADEWTRMTFSSDPRVEQPIQQMLLASREAVVDYMTPLGLHHMMATNHHYGPGPWIDNLRLDWNPVYYHRARADGIGFDRTATGSNAVAQYASPVAQRFGDLANCPENLLLWFHHVPWDYRMRSGRTLWDELGLHYQRGVDAVRGWQKRWASLRDLIDQERFEHVKVLLARQERDAREWRDACLLYFQTFSRRPLPPGVEPPEHPLDYYEQIDLHFVPGTPGEK
jgi:alpha-glucuronidase